MFSDFLADELPVTASFQGNVMAGMVFKSISLRLFVGVATIDFQVLGLRLEAGFTWLMDPSAD